MSSLYGRFCSFMERLVHGTYLDRISELEETLDISRDNLQSLFDIHREDQIKIGNQAGQLRAKEVRLDRIKVLLEVERTLAREARIDHLAKIRALRERCSSSERRLEILAKYVQIPNLEDLSQGEREAIADLLPKVSDKEPRDKIVIAEASYATNGVESFMGRLANVPYVSRVKYLGETNPQPGINSPRLGTSPNLINLTYGSSENRRAKISVKTTARDIRQGLYILEIVRRVS